MTNVAINDDILAQVMQMSGLQDKKDAINTALADYITLRRKTMSAHQSEQIAWNEFVTEAQQSKKHYQETGLNITLDET